MDTIEFYCYYKIDPEKLDLFRDLALKISELYSKHPGCQSYQFSMRLDPERKNTAMESGRFSDTEMYLKIKEEIETQHMEIFETLDTIIQGGLIARKFEFFTQL